MKLHCHICDTTIAHNLRKLSGCNCDPDAPTWVAIVTDGSLLTMSQANFTIIATEQQ